MSVTLISGGHQMRYVPKEHDVSLPSLHVVILISPSRKTVASRGVLTVLEVAQVCSAFMS